MPPTAEENAAAAKSARRMDWSAREKPSRFFPVQVQNYTLPLGFCDWWNTRSPLFCCCFPCMRCLSGRGNPFAVSVVDILDDSIWAAELAKPVDSAPESLRGVWFLSDNVAHENLVLFNDAVVEGEFDASGATGFGAWKHSMRTTWTRDATCFGWILLTAASVRPNQDVVAAFNFGAGKLKLNDREWVFRHTEDEWWKTHFEPGTSRITYMYRWLRVLRPDGTKTAHWADLERRATAKLPNSNCGTSWFPCWPCFLSDRQRMDDMVFINRYNSVVLPSGLPKAPVAQQMR